MSVGVQVVWWLGLVAAVPLTAVVLKLAVLVLRTLADIDELARRIGDSAERLADGLTAAQRLEALASPAATLAREAGELASAAAAVRRTVERPRA